MKGQINMKRDGMLWSEEMQKYCEGDTLVSLELFKYFETQSLDPRCFNLEHDFARIMARQESFGFPLMRRKLLL